MNSFPELSETFIRDHILSALNVSESVYLGAKTIKSNTQALEGYHDIIDWIMKIEPERYIIEYDEEYEEIIKFEINKKLMIKENRQIIENDIKECPICYDKICEIITCCDHQYCYHCFNEYYKKNSNICCPYCRKEEIKLYTINNYDIVNN